MTHVHYQTVFNGTRMVYRKVQPKRGGSVAPVVVEQTAPAPIAMPVAPKVDKKTLRSRIAADLFKVL
jgi:hypothetical protein